MSIYSVRILSSHDDFPDVTAVLTDVSLFQIRQGLLEFFMRNGAYGYAVVCDVHDLVVLTIGIDVDVP